MQGRRKWHRERSNLEVGTPVMLVDPALPRAHWLLGRVKTVVKGKDGRVRSAIVDTGRRTYHQPVARLIELPPLPDLSPPLISLCSNLHFNITDFLPVNQGAAVLKVCIFSYCCPFNCM